MELLTNIKNLLISTYSVTIWIITTYDLSNDELILMIR